MATEMKKILVTGGAGFIGKHLMKALGKRGISFDINTNKTFDINTFSMLDYIVQKIEPSAIIHLAAISSLSETDKDPTKAVYTNILGTYNVLRSGKRNNCRVILASSAAADEAGKSLYGTTKLCTELLAELFEDVVTVRMFNVYGKNSKSVVNKVIKAVQTGKKIKLNGNTIRDYIYIDDIVEALISLADAQSPNPYVQLGTGRGITLKKLVSITQKIVGKKAIVKQGPSIPEIQKSLYMNGWTKNPYYKTSLEQGIKNLMKGI